MSSKVIPLNKQRLHPVDIAWVEKTSNTLFSATLDNLKKKASKHVQASLIKELRERAILSLVLVSNREIQKLNKQWMNKNYPTDVLSFPLDLEPPPKSLPWEIGEIVISMEKTYEQAAEFGHSFEREFAFLFVHGTLHVLGFDHLVEAEEKDMFGRQKQILLDAGFPR